MNFRVGLLRPWSVSQIKGVRALPAMDVTFTWARRSRFGPDSWSGQDVPLNEQSESYDLEIMNGSSVVRTVYGLASPTFVYTAAMQTADFGAAQASYTIRVYQLSGTYGRGQVASETVIL